MQLPGFTPDDLEASTFSARRPEKAKEKTLPGGAAAGFDILTLRPRLRGPGVCIGALPATGWHLNRG